MRILGALTGLCLLMAACGGDSDGGGSSGGSSDPLAAAKATILTSANVFSGEKSARDLIDLYTPRCREGANEQDIENAIKLAQTFVPKVKGLKFEDADFGDKFEANKTATGYEVTIPSTKDSRLKVDGKWGNAHEQLVAIGLQEASEGLNTQEMTFELIDGKLLNTDCDALRTS